MVKSMRTERNQCQSFILIKWLKSLITDSRLYKILFTVLCSFGCFHQLYYITDNYLKFDVTTTVKIVLPEKYILPDMAICIKIAEFINITALSVNHPSLLNKMIKYEQQVNNVTVKDISKINQTVILQFVTTQLKINEVYSILYNETDLIKYWDIGIRKSVETEVTQSECKMRSRFKENLICITIGCSENTTQQYTELDYVRSDLTRSFFAISLNHTLFKTLSNVQVALLRPTTLPRGSLVNFIKLNQQESPHKYPLSYTKFERKLLPSPYVTQCVDYGYKQFDTVEHAREICLTNASMELFGAPFPGSLANPSWDTFFGKRVLDDSLANPSVEVELNRILKKCQQQTKDPNCIEIYLITTALDETPINAKESVIEIKIPTEPFIRTICTPSQTLLEYLVTVGSVMGTWYGFSFAFSLPYIISTLRSFWLKMCNSKQTPPPAIPIDPNLVTIKSYHSLLANSKQYNLSNTFYTSYYREKWRNRKLRNIY